MRGRLLLRPRGKGNGLYVLVILASHSPDLPRVPAQSVDHYHGDPYGPQCMYTEKNYTETEHGVHPMIIGIGGDGHFVYGRYTDAAQTGVNETLDDCGGHNHTGGFGYHCKSL